MAQSSLVSLTFAVESDVALSLQILAAVLNEEIESPVCYLGKGGLADLVLWWMQELREAYMREDMSEVEPAAWSEEVLDEIMELVKPRGSKINDSI